MICSFHRASTVCTRANPTPRLESAATSARSRHASRQRSTNARSSTSSGTDPGRFIRAVRRDEAVSVGRASAWGHVARSVWYDLFGDTCLRLRRVPQASHLRLASERHGPAALSFNCWR